MDVVAIVLAAGASRRYGRNKLLEPWGNTTVIGAVMDAVRASGVPAILVAGRDAEEVARAAGTAQVVQNDDFEAGGMSSSIVAGVGAVPEGSGLLIVLGDMPGLDPAIVRSVVEQGAPDRIVVPIYRSFPDHPGHPVLFGSAFRADLLALKGDQGARSVLEAHGQHVQRLPVEGGQTDVDYPQDLLKRSPASER